ncbi:MAG: phosphoethanolamine transferase, partial [Burkholderiaceae bacterium]
DFSLAGGPAAGAMRPRLARPALSVETLALLCALFLILTGNGPLWRAALAGRDWHAPGTWSFAAALLVALSALHFVLLGLVASRHTVKPLLSVLVLCTAFASYYMERYSIFLDRTMLRNVLATDYKEARELLAWGMVPHLVVSGAFPLALLWWPRLKQVRLRSALVKRLLWLGAALVIAVASLLAVFADFASLMRNQPALRYLITPGNGVVALARNALGRAQAPAQARTRVGEDAKLGAAWAGRQRPALFVLVVGETARAANFSLNGYARETNPLLARRDVVSFSAVTACGTSTEVSLPCMFSPFGRADYDEDRIQSHESLLHVLARAGFQVLWRDNQSGCKGVCEGLSAQQLDHAQVPALCFEGQCLDEVLLHGMEGVARDAAGNLFVVMHQLGSHGPAYYRRYPGVFKRFVPACESDDLRHCSQQEIVNAYDNSLLYTDYFLSRVVDLLDRSQSHDDTAMIYVSDHGESLGENGLYLHGMPYSVAPAVQKQVPMLVWLSPALRRSFGVDGECLRAHAKAPASHDNLFHSVLGLLDVQTVVYRRPLDVFAPCRVASG